MAFRLVWENSAHHSRRRVLLRNSPSSSSVFVIATKIIEKPDLVAKDFSKKSVVEMYSFILFAVSSMVNYAISSSSSAHEEEDMLMPPPPGYHFVPSHSQIIEIYLGNKILGHPLSSNMIKEMDWMQQLDPEQLPFHEFTYCRKNEAYFITPTKERNTEGSRTILTTTSGYWKASKDVVPVFNSERIVGYKKTYVFYQGNEPAGEKTLWRMNEYRVSPDIIPSDALDDDVCSKIEQFVACKIRYKKPESPAEPLQEEPLKEEEEEDDDEQEE